MLVLSLFCKATTGSYSLGLSGDNIFNLFLNDYFELSLASSQPTQAQVHLDLWVLSMGRFSPASKGFVSQICAVIQWFHLLWEQFLPFTETAEEYFWCSEQTLAPDQTKLLLLSPLDTTAAPYLGAS